MAKAKSELEGHLTQVISGHVDGGGNISEAIDVLEERLENLRLQEAQTIDGEIRKRERALAAMKRRRDALVPPDEA